MYQPTIVLRKRLDVYLFPAEMPLERVTRAFGNAVGRPVFHAHTRGFPVQEAAMPDDRIQLTLPLAVKTAGTPATMRPTLLRAAATMMLSLPVTQRQNSVRVFFH